MSTVFSIRYDICPHCNRYYEIEIGTQAGVKKGQCRITFKRITLIEHFEKIDPKIALTQYEDDNIIQTVSLISWKSLRDFLEYYTSIDTVKIYDEYNRNYTFQEFCKLVKEDKAPLTESEEKQGDYSKYFYLDDSGYYFMKEGY
jgi:hypothetical protein